MARQMEAVPEDLKDLSSEKPVSDGKSERAEGGEPQEASLTRQAATRRKALKSQKPKEGKRHRLRHGTRWLPPGGLKAVLCVRNATCCAQCV